jgi:hypothetical protein
MDGSMDRRIGGLIDGMNDGCLNICRERNRMTDGEVSSYKCLVINNVIIEKICLCIKATRSVHEKLRLIVSTMIKHRLCLSLNTVP